MCSQIAFESDMRRKGSYRELFTKKYIRRTLLGCLIVNMTKLSGSNIIQAYQTVMYGALGFKGQTVLLIAALYGFMAVIGQILSLFTLSDFWPRKRTVSKCCNSRPNTSSASNGTRSYRSCHACYHSEHPSGTQQVLSRLAQSLRFTGWCCIHLPLRLLLLVLLQHGQLGASCRNLPSPSPSPRQWVCCVYAGHHRDLA